MKRVSTTCRGRICTLPTPQGPVAFRTCECAFDSQGSTPSAMDGVHGDTEEQPDVPASEGGRTPFGTPFSRNDQTAIAGLIHDFSNLLTVAAGRAEILHDRAGDPALADALDRIRQPLAHARRLIERFDGQAAQDRSPEPSTVPGVAIAEAGPLLRDLAGVDRVLRLGPPRSRWAVAADPAELVSCIANLVLNASEACGTGGSICVDVEDIRFSNPVKADTGWLAAGDHVCVRVIDTGPGIPENVRRQAFRPGWSTKERDRPSGFGLFNVGLFSARAGGGVRILSPSGGGAQIEVILPRAGKSRYDPDGCPMRSEYGGRERVLLVDASAHARELGRWRIASLGYDVVDVATVEEACGILSCDGSVRVVVSAVSLSSPCDSWALLKWIDARCIPVGVILSLTDAEPYRSLDGRVLPDNVDILPCPHSRKALARSLRRALELAWSEMRED